MLDTVLDWYDTHARDLPWRGPERSAWGVLVSEVMLQQTPVNRVVPVWHAWMDYWPTPAALAEAQPADAIRAWGRLGYPRRALRLHNAATVITVEHGGVVPADHATLLSLPGVGEYTAAAVASFAFGQRHPVLDTNVRRVYARVRSGAQYPPPAITAAERRLGVELLPADPAQAARWAVAVMELGALVCTARAPRCDQCPLRADCAWRLAGSPPHDGAPRRGQAWAGTDRQARGQLLAVLREAEEPVTRSVLATVWSADADQLDRALAGLVADGLAEQTPDGRYRLPHG